MSGTECRKFYVRVRREAMRAARSWDLSPATIDAIRHGRTCGLNEMTVASFEVGDTVVHAQLIGAFAYAVTMLDGSLAFSADESVHTSAGTVVLILDIAPPRTTAKEGGGHA